MVVSRITLVILVVAGVSVLPAAAPLWALVRPVQDPGMHEEVLELPEGPLRYTISLPKGYKPDAPRPLVLGLHYGGQVTPYVGKGLLVQLVEPGLRELGAIMVAPDCPSRSWNNPASEKAVLALVDYILASYTIDRRRILVTGFSMGGHGTWYMASRHPDLFSAAIPIAGTPVKNDIESAAKLPFYVIHSEDDEVVPIEPAKEAAQTLESLGAPIKLVILHGISHYEVPGFVPALMDTVDWVKQIWEE